MDAAALKAELEEAGITLLMDGIRLVLEGPATVLSAELVERCRASKEELLDMLQPPVRKKPRWSGPFEAVDAQVQLGSERLSPRHRQQLGLSPRQVVHEPRRFMSGCPIDPEPRRRRSAFWG